MLDIESFHSRLCEFSANVILDYNEMTRPMAKESRLEGTPEVKPSVEQGDLFADLQEKIAPAVSPKAKEAITESPKPRPAQKIETKPLTYKDYLRIHLGNKAAAMYWWERNEGRPQR